MSKKQNTFEKRRRDMEKKLRADEKRKKRLEKKKSDAVDGRPGEFGNMPSHADDPAEGVAETRAPLRVAANGLDRAASDLANRG